MRRCGEWMVAKAARQEPTPKGYHTGTRVAARESSAKRCVLSRKARHWNPRLLSLHKYGGATLGCRGGSRSRFQETWPVVDEQPEDCACENEAASHHPAEVLGQVKLRRLYSRQMK